MLNRLSLKDLLVRCHILALYDNIFSAHCGYAENRDHLFINCNVFCSLWLLILGWLDISTTLHGNIQNNLLQFGSLNGFSKNSRLFFNTI